MVCALTCSTYCVHKVSASSSSCFSYGAQKAKLVMSIKHWACSCIVMRTILHARRVAETLDLMCLNATAARLIWRECKWCSVFISLLRFAIFAHVCNFIFKFRNVVVFFTKHLSHNNLFRRLPMGVGITTSRLIHQKIGLRLLVIVNTIIQPFNKFLKFTLIFKKSALVCTHFLNSVSQNSIFLNSHLKLSSQLFNFKFGSL